jgi:hypothetical protein
MIGSTLIKIRQDLNFKSARAFYQDYLARRTRLDFNYSYYMKIEGDKLIPSPSVLNTICAVFDEERSDDLVLAYCETIFPAKEGLFRKARRGDRPKDLATRKGPETKTLIRQKFLTPLQVANIGKSQSHYYLFLILTLARKPVHKSVLAKHFKGGHLDSLLSELEKAQLIFVKDGQANCISNEMKFPEAQSARERKLHEQIDLWNQGFSHWMNFEANVQKMLLRRVSPRYLSVIQAHCDVLLNIIRASDEIDPEYNDDVLMLNLSLHRGNLPG